MSKLLAGISEEVRPNADQFQVVVLGRGVGESILLHVGDGQWVVVDSFMLREPDGARVPAALYYLDSIGVSRDQIVAVVMSHFDVDHVRGAADVFQAAATDAALVLSGAMAVREFLAQLRLADRPGRGGDAGLTELRALIEVLEAPSNCRRLERCRRDQFILRKLESQGSVPVFTYGMAPSEDTIGDFSGQLAPVIDGPLPSSLPRPLLNRASAALHVQVGNVAALLCGDLEEDPRVGCGQRGWAGAMLPPNGVPATLVKLGHHGSNNGDHDDIWTRLAAAQCVTATAPFAAQPEPLPRGTDVARVRGRGHALYVAGGASEATPSRSTSGRLARLSAAGVQVQKRESQVGAVVATCAADGTGTWGIQRFGSTSAWS